MDLGISGRKAIVCASSRGLGRACAMSLAEAGVDLVINGRDEQKLASTQKELEKFGVTVTVVMADVSSAEGQAALFAACPAPDILVNNNGGPPFRDFREIDREAMLAGVTMNMVTPLELIRACVDGMGERGWGRIVNITSSSVVSPIPGLDLSSGARAGLTSFLAGVSRSVASTGVTINQIMPGAFDTDRLQGGIRTTAERLGESYEDAAAKRAASIPAGRFGQPEEFGAACAFLCSTHASYITGQSLLIDGGAVNKAF
ncbi:SDR family oxidoreductase [Granulosicoccus antarcticus]|uniref:Bacilysin biosynthesis oxidoreductase YwfH n=1 Tax=Granulosicoccus antarcticus IMCC3135 TaxID=1192854 RepID=A0A2Z2NWC3_9GAMM|nr:SDR family oxidoreductase [Granulosicoccus antarcticus]ASJ74351.1 Bacilysin biosynthesis oxidoreductase YwfH [Granulosicoccus antarcticus IMCC3135]